MPVRGLEHGVEVLPGGIVEYDHWATLMKVSDSGKLEVLRTWNGSLSGWRDFDSDYD